MRLRPSTRVWLALVALWVAFIWGHSLIQGPASSAESGRAVALLRPFFEVVHVSDQGLMTFIVRKTAHFLEYALLGALVVGCRASMGEGAPRRRLLWALLPAVPVMDETLQLFVPGRSGSLRDVAIDLCGALFGIFVARFILCRFMHTSNVSG